MKAEQEEKKARQELIEKGKADAAKLEKDVSKVEAMAAQVAKAAAKATGAAAAPVAELGGLLAKPSPADVPAPRPPSYPEVKSD